MAVIFINIFISLTSPVQIFIAGFNSGGYPVLELCGGQGLVGGGLIVIAYSQIVSVRALVGAVKFLADTALPSVGLVLETGGSTHDIYRQPFYDLSIRLRYYRH